jgi:hypothetical protein
VPSAAPARIHIVGISPRTGTTLLAECMVACLDIDGFEPHEASIARLRFGCRVYLTKRPADLRFIRPRLRLDPDFHAICLMRDPRDVIVSRHGKDPNRYWVPLRVWKQRWPIYRQLLEHERFTVVRYEDLVTDPDGVERRLIERMPFLFPRCAFSTFPAVAAPSEAALRALGGVRRLDAESVGNWRRHLPRVAGQIALHGPIADELVALGYERDRSWMSILDGVTPDLAASRIAERRRRRWLRRPSVGLPWMSAGLVAAARAVGVRIV